MSVRKHLLTSATAAVLLAGCSTNKQPLAAHHYATVSTNGVVAATPAEGTVHSPTVSQPPAPEPPVVPTTADTDRRVTVLFTGAEISQVLSIYREIAGVELLVFRDTRPRRPSITIGPTEPILIPEAIRLIETALREQGGVLLKRRDDGRVVVTYDDASRVTPRP